MKKLPVRIQRILFTKCIGLLLLIISVLLFVVARCIDINEHLRLCLMLMGIPTLFTMPIGTIMLFGRL